MNLKESFRYQNFLDNLLNSIISHFSYQKNYTVTTQEHLKSKSNTEAFDEKITVINENKLPYNNNLLMDFATDIINQKSILGNAIAKAKLSVGFDIDSSISTNKSKQVLSRVMGEMAKLKSSERIVKGTGYKFNNEGNQTAYNYDIKEVISIDFDRNKAKGISKDLIASADSVSSDIDRVMIDTDVGFSTTYNVNDTLEDALEQYISIH